MIFRRNMFVCCAALIASFAVAIAASAFDGGAMEIQMHQEAARQKALDKLLQQLRAEEIDDELTFGDLLDRIEGDIAWEALFKGVEQLKPVRHYANGDTEVVLRISSETLKANIAALIEERLPEEGIGLDALVFEAEGADEFIIVKGIEKRIMKGDPPVAGPPSGLQGWANVSARDRARVERKMMAEVRDSVRESIAKMFVEHMDQVEADKFAEKIAARILPESKAYMTDGVIEIVMIVDPQRIESILELEDSPFSLEDGDRLIETLTNLYGWSFEEIHRSYVDGREMEMKEFERLGRYEPLEQEDFPPAISRRTNAAEPRPELDEFQMPIDF